MRKWIDDKSTGTTVDFNAIKAVTAEGVLIDGTWVELSSTCINEIDKLIESEKRFAETKAELD